jgi:hypothetical protein
MRVPRPCGFPPVPVGCARAVRRRTRRPKRGQQQRNN